MEGGGDLQRLHSQVFLNSTRGVAAGYNKAANSNLPEDDFSDAAQSIPDPLAGGLRIDPQRFGSGSHLGNPFGE